MLANLLIFLEITNTTKLFVHALVNSKAIEIFIDWGFIEKYYLCKLSKPMSIYNINRTPNKNEQISEVVDIVLYYQMYSE